MIAILCSDGVIRMPQVMGSRFSSSLLDFGFPEQHVLACLRVIFFQLKFFRLGAWVFLSHIVKPGVCSADELDL